MALEDNLLTLTDSAIKRLEFLFAIARKPVGEGGKGYEDPVFYIEVVSGGCNGFENKMKIIDGGKIENNMYEEDGRYTALLLYEQGGVTVAMPTMSELYLRGSTINYHQDEEGLESRMVVENPNADSQCGCGFSYSINSIG